MRRHAPTKGLLVGLLAVLLLLTGCFKVEGQINVADDGSVDVDFLSALDVETAQEGFGSLLEGEESNSGLSDELCEGFAQETDLNEGLPADAEITPYEEDGFCGSRVQYTLPAATNHSAAMQTLFDSESQLYKEGDMWFFETAFDVDDLTSDAGELPGIMVDNLLGEASFRIELDLPGDMVDGAHNATEIGPDGQFIWDLDILNPPARLFAQTDTSNVSGGFSPLLIALIVAALIGLAALFIYLSKRPSSSSPSDVPGTAPLPATAGEMPTTGDVYPSFAAPQDPAPPDHIPHDAVVDTYQPGASSVRDTVVVPDATTAADPGEPAYDAGLGAWIFDDPVRGRLRHDPATGDWNPL